MQDHGTKCDQRYVSGSKGGPGTVLEILHDFVSAIWQFDGQRFVGIMMEYVGMLGEARRRKLQRDPVLYQCPLFTLIWFLLWPVKCPGSKVSEQYKKAAARLVEDIHGVTGTAVRKTDLLA